MNIGLIVGGLVSVSAGIVLIAFRDRIGAANRRMLRAFFGDWAAGSPETRPGPVLAVVGVGWVAIGLYLLVKAST